MREQITRNIDLKPVFGEWEVWHRYTYGIAGERFFRAMKEEARLLASVCPQCHRAFLPPSLYCEDCFAEMSEYRPVEAVGTVQSFTVLHESLEEMPLPEPVLIAFVGFEGIVGGWLAPLRGLALDQVQIGMRVKAVWKPADQRQGQVGDLAYFEPA